MSVPASPPVRETPRAFRPRAFLLGLAAGLLAGVLAGHWAARNHAHPAFVRFAPRISPEGNYYPTLDEMRAVVRARVAAGQVPVIVGGNSVFQGVGQPADRIWTLELQRLLGPRFVVVNLALRGSSIVDGGAVVAESLQGEFPGLVYVANTAPWTNPHPAGLEPYTYLADEARARGLLEAMPARDALVAGLRRSSLPLAARLERVAVAHADRWLRFRDLWNWVGFNLFFTIPSPLTPSGPVATAARGRLPDEEPDFETMPAEVRMPPFADAQEMAITRAFSQSAVEPDGAGGWRLRPGVAEQFRAIAGAALPPSMRRRTLVVLSRNSPVFRNRLTAEEQTRDDFAFASSLAAWREAGYHAAEYGRDFAPADYGDRTHLSARGGRRLAAALAPEVRAVADALGSPSPLR
jgi:hypothetical protein